MPPKRSASHMDIDEDYLAKKPSRRRSLVLPNGEELDLASVNENGDVKAVVIAAMKARIIQLEDELEAMAPLPKRARKAAPVLESSATAGVSSPIAGSSASVKAEDKKRKLQVKKIYDRLKKECKADGLKFQGSSKQVKFEEVFEYDEFQAIFGGKGVLIQPTPQNKPKSTVTIIEFRTPAAVRELFGDELKALKGNRWTRGGGPSFAKSLKMGQCDVNVLSLEVNYSKNGMKCTLKFEVEEEGGDNMCYVGPSQRRSFGGGSAWGLFY